MSQTADSQAVAELAYSDTAHFTVNGNTYKTWYQVYGDLKSKDRMPLVILHGGPGLSHNYMLPNIKLYQDFNIPIVLYDQLGCGKSSHISDVPPSFWTVDLYMDELENLLRHLNLREYDILGHSWGGMLGSNFAAARQPKGLRRLILANCPASISLANAGIALLIQASFSQEFLETMKRHEANGTTDSLEYKTGQMQFAQKHICTLDPWPKDLMDSFAEHEKDITVNNAMMGGYLLQTTGTMKDWDVVPILSKISSSTLLLHSPTDEVHETAIKPFYENIPKIKWVEFCHSSHLAQFEEPERYFQIVSDFLS